MNRFRLFALCIALIVVCVPFVPARAASASLYLSPSARSYDLGATFAVTVYVSTDESMNAAAGTISFPSDKLQVVSLSKTGSIFSLWAQEPTFSNSAGTVTFEGVVLNPGFSGSAGKILIITFRAKAAGDALVRFSSGSVLANDGQGTNIISGMGSAQYTIGNVGPEAPAGTTVETVIGAPRAPSVVSETHPDSTKWYATKTARFSWPLPQGTTGVRLLYGKMANALPTTTYIPPIASREITDLTDGVWYFHAQFRNEVGWGGVTHFRFQIDAEKPTKFELKPALGDALSPRAKFFVDAHDALSGIENYEMRIDNGEPAIWRDESGNGVYETPALEPGKHILVAKAFDKAGNYLTASQDFEITALDAPLITGYPKEMYSDAVLVIRGMTYPDVKMTAKVRRDKGEEKIQHFRSENDGTFTFVSDEKLESGAYTVAFRAENDEGAKSWWSEPVAIAVRGSFFSRIISFLVSSLSSIIVVVAVALLLVLLASFFLKKFSHLRRSVKATLAGVESTIHSHFDDLRQDVTEALRILEHTSSRRELTEEEERIRKHLAKSLEGAERAIRKELRDFEKKVK